VVLIRQEKPEDLPQIHSVIVKTFKRDAEARLADKLRHVCPECLSLVAEEDNVIVGHVMFTPVQIINGKTVHGMGLAPMAVVPSRQRRGIGKLLIKAGLKILQEKGCPFVIVLGHPEYYPRLGFQPASRFNIRSQWEDVPDEAFMILIMDESAMRNVSGIARFRDEFSDTF
jgi:putative acetyltransferase